MLPQLTWEDYISSDLVKKIKTVTRSNRFVKRKITEQEYNEITAMREWNGDYINLHRPVAVNKEKLTIFSF